MIWKHFNKINIYIAGHFVDLVSKFLNIDIENILLVRPQQKNNASCTSF